MITRRICWCFIFCISVGLLTSEVNAQSDWDLYMLRLVNRARQDPSGEAVRIGSSVMDTRPAVAPLAYDLTIAQAAKNHNDWMHNNLGGIASSKVPDSFSHYETLDGLETGAPATGTPNYTGVGVDDRVTFVGFVWDRVGENILNTGSSVSLPINQSLIEDNHFGWWESDGHRNAMLSGEFAVFGHYAESRAITPPIGNINPPYDNLHFATQDYARPFNHPQTYILGLLYEDKNNSGNWSPKNSDDPMREGLGGAQYEVFIANTNTSVTTGTTMANGAFSINIDDGTYDIEFTASAIPGGSLTVSNITVSGQNVDAGDYEINNGGSITNGGGSSSGSSGTSGSAGVSPAICGMGTVMSAVLSMFGLAAIRFLGRRW